MQPWLFVNLVAPPRERLTSKQMRHKLLPLYFIVHLNSIQILCALKQEVVNLL